jgi:hypothetical protein
MTARMPWQDCPKCPMCPDDVKSNPVIPAEAARKMHLFDRILPGARLVCIACGHSWEGTDAEHDQAVDAQDCWESHKREMDKGRSMSWDPKAREQ